MKLQAAREESHAGHEKLTAVNKELTADVAAMTRHQDVGDRLVQEATLARLVHAGR